MAAEQPLPSSAVLAKMRLWVEQPFVPPAILSKATPEQHARRVRAMNLLQLADRDGGGGDGGGGDEERNGEALLRLKRLRASALDRSDLPRSTAFIQMIFGGKYEPRKPARPYRPRANAKVVEVKPNVAAVSRISGRTVKTPSKFKDRASRGGAHGRMQLQLSPRASGASNWGGAAGGSQRGGGARRGGRAARGGAAGAEGEDDGESDEMEADDDDLVPEIRVGPSYQADVPPQAASLASSAGDERADTLMWSGVRMLEARTGGMRESALDAYLGAALPMVGGPLREPPSSASAQVRCSARVRPAAAAPPRSLRRRRRPPMLVIVGS